MSTDLRIQEGYMDRHDMRSNATGTESRTGPAYLAPTMTRLGTLGDPTLAGAAGIPDGLGGADGSLLPP
jgi:hypothetical protein